MALVSAPYARYPILHLPLLESQPTVVMSNCIHNQLDSLGHRYLAVTPPVNTSAINFDLLERIVNDLVDDICVHFKPEFNFKEYVMAKPGAVRKRFLKAYSAMSKGDRNLTSNSRITAFVKNERYFKEGKAPRMIMGRDPKFNIVYSRFIARLEDAFFKLDQVCNSCNFQSCGKKFSDVLSQCSSGFENDMESFEGSQQEFILALEYFVYNKVFERMCPTETDDLLTVFACKCDKFSMTCLGCVAKFIYCRGSGDLDTGLGNGIINYITTRYYMCVNFCDVNCKLSKCECLNKCFRLKGDDSYGASPKKESINTYLYFGLKAKLIYRADLRDVEFCSGHFIRMSNGSWIYVQKLRKLLTSVSTCINPEIISNGWLGHYIKSLGMMYNVLYDGVPIYQDFAKMLMTVNVKHGINTNLIEGVSYGAWEAFKHSGNTEKVACCPETLLDIAEHNEMPFAQLEALRTVFQGSNIILPAHFLKRCNKRNKPDESFTDPGDVINTWIFKKELSKETRHLRRRLRKVSKDFKYIRNLAAGSQ